MKNIRIEYLIASIMLTLYAIVAFADPEKIPFWIGLFLFNIWLTLIRLLPKE